MVSVELLKAYCIPHPETAFDGLWYLFCVARCCKCKGSSLDIAPLTILDIGALQPLKWQLTGIDCSTAAQASGSPWPALTDYWAHRHTTPQSTTLGLHPVIHVPNYMDHYSFTDP